VVAFASLILIVICTAVFWYQALDRDLSEPPRREAGPLPPNVPISLMSLNVTLPFDRLAATAESDTPKDYSGGADGPPVCASLGVKLCVGTRYDFSATRGPLSFTAGPGNSIRIAMPLKVTGHGGFRGSGAKLLRLDAKRFEATSDAYADVSIGLTPDWCPSVQVKVGYSNLDARLEIVSGAWISVSSLIESSVRDQLRRLGERAADALKCEDLRKTMESAWVSRSFPLPLPGDSRALHVNLEPVSVGFSGVHVTAAGAQLQLSVGARVSVSDTALDVAARPLPRWQPVPLKQAGLQLTVPLRISYEGLESRLASLTGKALSLATPAGDATLIADQIVVYPAGERIAVGAHVHAQLPGRMLSTRGWLYVTARPVVSPDGRSVRFADISYSRLLDSRIANVLTVMLDSQIRDRLTSAGQFDLSPTIAKAKELLAHGLAEHNKQVSLDMGEPSLRIGRIIPGAGSLLVEALFTSRADVMLLGEARP
jgi:hypothetical protein